MGNFTEQDTLLSFNHLILVIFTICITIKPHENNVLKVCLSLSPSMTSVMYIFNSFNFILSTL